MTLQERLRILATEVKQDGEYTHRIGTRDTMNLSADLIDALEAALAKATGAGADAITAGAKLAERVLEEHK